MGYPTCIRGAARRPEHGQAGLSLLEVVVGLAIVAILLTVAANGWSLITSRRLTNQARKMASDLRMIEQRARTERTCYRIVFSPSGEAYNIQQYTGTVVAAPPGGGNQCPDAWPTALAFQEVSGDTVSRRMPPRTDLVSTTFGSDTVTFSPTGNPNAGTVTIRGDTGQRKQVIVDVIGRVRITP